VEEHDPLNKLLHYVRLSSVEHENSVTTPDFNFAFLRLQAKGKCSILLEGVFFERMTKVAITVIALAGADEGVTDQRS